MFISPQVLAEAVHGKLIAGPANTPLAGGVNTDSRKKMDNSIFFALSGDKFDGNDYAAAAAQNGAEALVVTRPIEDIPASCAVIQVKDTLLALQDLAAWWKHWIDGTNVICISGSNGKTSTKDFTKSVLSQKFKTSATLGNFNNHIGLPLTILKTAPDDEAAVWEIGTNHPGELTPLCDLAQPTIGIITCIGSSHIEFFKTRKGIAEEKATVARHLPPFGALILPEQDDFCDYLKTQTKAKVITVGGPASPVQASNIKQTSTGSQFNLTIKELGTTPVTINVPGDHMINNALLAAAAGWVMGETLEQIAQGLQNTTLTQGRLRLISQNGYTLIDDTYNANPDSMVAALTTLFHTQTHGKRIAVLGAMGELGSYHEEGHRRVGSFATSENLDTLIVVGEKAQFIETAARESNSPTQILFFPTHEGAILWLNQHKKEGDTILFKGSHSTHMENIMNTVFPLQ